MQTPGSYNENAPVKQSAGDPPSRPTFLIACWLLALLAFAQLIAVGAAFTSGRTVADVPEAIPKTISAPLRVRKPVALEPRTIEQILASVGPHSTSTAKVNGSNSTTQVVTVPATTGG